LGRKNVTKPYKLLDAVSMASNQTSTVINTEYWDNVGFLVNWTGASGTGEIFVDVSNDKDESPSNWVELDFGNPISITGASGSHIININQLPFAKMRLRYSELTTAAGSLTVTLVSKQLGG
jgi:hypothetical protein